MKSPTSLETPNFDLFIQEVAQNDVPVIYSCGVWDADQRRMLAVEVVPARKNSRTRIVRSEEAYADKTTGLAALVRMRLREISHQIPHHITAVRMDSRGSILFWSADSNLDATVGTDYLPLSEYRIPSCFGTILRSDLTEIERLGTADIVSYQTAMGERRCVFKYYLDHSELRPMWHEIQILSQLPPHPNLLPMDKIVLEEVHGTGVVGFTAPYIPNHVLRPDRRQTFKLKWLFQLMRTVDDLHFRFGIAHRAITAQNLVVDPETDNIVLSNFSRSEPIDKRGDLSGSHACDWGEGSAARVDIKGAMFTLYGIITRHLPSDWSLDFAHEMDIMERRKWIRHVDVELDNSVDVFYNTLMGWATRRRTNSAGPSCADLAILPFRREPPPQPYFASLEELRSGTTREPGAHWHRRAARLAGIEIVSWERPPKSKVDSARRLLATGRYEEEERILRKRRIDERRGRHDTQNQSEDARLDTPGRESQVAGRMSSAASGDTVVGFAPMLSGRVAEQAAEQPAARQRIRRKAAQVAAMRIKATALESGVFREHRQRRRKTRVSAFAENVVNKEVLFI